MRQWDIRDYPEEVGRVPDLTYGKGHCCSAEWREWACTRRAGHVGRHAAGTGTIIVAVWSD